MDGAARSECCTSSLYRLCPYTLVSVNGGAHGESVWRLRKIHIVYIYKYINGYVINNETNKRNIARPRFLVGFFWCLKCHVCVIYRCNNDCFTFWSKIRHGVDIFKFKNSWNHITVIIPRVIVNLWIVIKKKPTTRVAIIIYKCQYSGVQVLRFSDRNRNPGKDRMRLFNELYGSSKNGNLYNIYNTSI